MRGVRRTDPHSEGPHAGDVVWTGIGPCRRPQVRVRIRPYPDGERGLTWNSDHWRTLLDVTNAVVTKRDLGELRAAIAPERPPHRPARPHEPVSRRRTARACSRSSSIRQRWPWPEHLSESIHLDAEPYKSWLSRVVDIDVDNADPTGWEDAARARRGVRREADLQRPVVGAAPRASACCRSAG